MRRLLPAVVLAVFVTGFPATAQAAEPLAKPPGTRPMTSKTAAKYVTPAPENRPQNAEENQAIPSLTALEAWRSVCYWPRCDTYVNGRYRGTTDEIIQWASRKWGFHPRILRSVAVSESYWDMDQLGDFNSQTGEYDSYCMFQIKRPYHFTTPNIAVPRDHSAFCADYFGGILRAYYDGTQTWLNDVEHGKPYEAGDLWGSIGVWYSGRWYDAGAVWYIDRIKNIYRERPWAQPGF